MKLSFSMLTLTCALIIAFSAQHVEAQNLTFENLAGTGTNNGYYTSFGSAITENGFTVSAYELDAYGPTARYPVNGYFNYTGSIALLENHYQDITIAPTLGGTFTLNSIDVANFVIQSASPGAYPSSVTFTGNIFGGGTVTQTYNLLAEDNLQTVTFGSAWTDLSSVVLTDVQIDNVVLNNTATTPEPGSIALLLGLTTTGAVFLIRRRKHANKAT